MEQGIVFLDARGRPWRVSEVFARRYSLEEYIEKARPIVADVARRGYRAVREYSERFDQVGYEDPVVEDWEVEEAYRSVGERVLWALRVAVERVKRFQEQMLPRARGGFYWRPVERVGVYVPGGAHPYPSTAVMTVVPASVAGARVVYVVTPPCPRCPTKAHPLTVAAAVEAGATRVYAIGGAQAVAGLAYAAKPLPEVDMVAGPGGPYVQAAKLLVASRVGIDMVAGPTELVVVALEGAEPEAVALDVLAEAEHGPLSVAFAVTPSEELAEDIASALERLLGGASDVGLVGVVLVESLEEAVEAVNMFAPEHLEVAGEEDAAQRLAVLAYNAGVVAVNTPPALLDYAAGPSHVLPTGGAARWRAGLSVYDFLRPQAVVENSMWDREALEAAIVLAEAEGFKLHAESLRHRLRGGAGLGPL